MKKTMLILSMLAFCASAQAAIKPCEELKEEIAAKIDAKGVPSYSLKVVPIDADEPGRQVGTCDGGTKKIIYVRG
ncbi:MAG: hypothetical protein CVU26_07470 [Betaproteobacteria bacterium HGW-Betaproteobacteria-2]|nr:MAG: hypothetical protein CVU26_07470 [Betaproteobacteria bacterium HGW-Betaproteobacteria-2]